VRSATKAATLALVVLVGSAVAESTSAAAAQSVAPEALAPQPTEDQVDEAVAKLRQDPNLGPLKKHHRLQWTNPAQEDKKPSGWLEWLGQAIEWFAGTARALLWVAGILLVGVVGLFIKRFLELRGERASPLKMRLPTHVRDLDIRPESLPDDIGATALDLWERGEHRPALSLLYRGVLSRLAHVHGVPIRDSSTEGDCLQLAATHLAVAPAAYVTRVVRLWQRAVYGSLDPTAEEMRALCTGFATALDRSSAALSVEQAA
jgi:hypothetical protein